MLELEILFFKVYDRDLSIQKPYHMYNKYLAFLSLRYDSVH